MIGLLELDPDLAKFITAQECVAAEKLKLRVHDVAAGGEGADLDALLAREQAFGAIVVEGILAHRLQVADQLGVRLLGAGDIVIYAPHARLMVLADSQLSATRDARLALLDDALLVAVRHWPVLAMRLLERFAEQTQALAAQFVITQMPRVDQRVFALLWLLAERWGRVTRSGTYLPLKVTHQMLGALIGARRPTVTLAMTQLADRGALIKQPQGYLLIEPPPQPTGSMSASDQSTLTGPLPCHKPDRSRARPTTPLQGDRPTTLANPQAAQALSREQRRRAGLLRQRSRQLTAWLPTTQQRKPASEPPPSSDEPNSVN
jgi:CRP/FNR family transcriptional regulator, cyclic AMP receptor protein